MNTALRLGFRYTLDTVTAGFKFELPVDAIARHFSDHFFITAVLPFVGADDLYTPAAGFSITAVHAEQVTGENRRFVTTGSCTDFQEAAAFVIGIFWQQQ